MRILALFAVVALLFLAGVAHAQIVQAGEYTIGPSTEGNSLIGGNGERTYVQPVTFAKPFTVIPQVLTSLSGFDATNDDAQTLRMQVSATKITKTGFTLRAKTWGDGKVGALWGNWIAVGAK